MLWTAPRRVESLSLLSCSSARRVGRHRLSSVMATLMASTAKTAGKNANRVAAQVRRQVKLQRDRAISHVVVSIVLIGVGVAPIFVSIIPTVVQVICLALLPFSLFGIYADHRLYRKQQERLQALKSGTGG
jgi:hypothetical protein